MKLRHDHPLETAAAKAAMCQDHHVAPLADGRGPAQPRAQPAVRHAHHATQMAVRKAALIAANELKLHGF